jgi:hypothetical protein
VPNSIRHRLCYARFLLSIIGAFAVTSASAGFVTINPAELTQIFSQTSFGDNKVEVRVNPPVTVNAPGLQVINTEAQLNQLFALDKNNGPVIDVFFVDAINECGDVFLPAAIGCGEQQGNKLAVESDFAAQPKASGEIVSPGSVLIAHEIGHNLGLEHINPPPGNLLNPILSGNIDLTSEQVAIILNSSLVQNQNGQEFISITPFAIVPEPTAMLFALAGAVCLLTSRRRRTSV